jgi:BirA family biotin operon repressor/biotin-[acetyl-CoA-carboxylase] ligase
MTFDIASVRARLPGRRLDWFDALASTMIEAARDPQLGRVVGAEEQTAGMGRHGRSWHSPKGQGLYVSIVLPATPLPVIMLGLGLAVWDALRAQAESLRWAFDLRWPNDVLLRQRKCAGVLATAGRDCVIAGIGINVSQRAFPPDLDTPATSLALEGAAVAREALLVRLIEAVDHAVTLPPEEVLRRFASASSYARGRRVRAEDVEGVTCGLDPAGFLRVREDNGTMHTILAGGVRPA